MKFEMENLNPNDIAQAVFETFNIQAKEKGLELKFEKGADALVVADKNRLRQVVINLLGNSIKYTQAGSVALITRLEKGHFEIRISDTGIGISAEDQKNLFSKFYRVKSKETQAIIGTGLGLWITKQIVEEMKGTISVESIRGKGSEFIVRLPIVRGS
jgi:two-component system phosphate regulon sensor histidine kinase PhoR